jgi:hypothetical protein
VSREPLDPEFAELVVDQFLASERD